MLSRLDMTAEISARYEIPLIGGTISPELAQNPTDGKGSSNCSRPICMIVCPLFKHIEYHNGPTRYDDIERYTTPNR